MAVVHSSSLINLHACVSLNADYKVQNWLPLTNDNMFKIKNGSQWAKMLKPLSFDYSCDPVYKMVLGGS